jgi:GT2 family glycosyltransferase/glycosyltransferase involved in cell wall biosynthesis
MTSNEPAPDPGDSAVSAQQRAAEQAKWDAYYRDLPDHVVDEPTAAFHRELIETVSELLPDGGKLLEAGCGGGNQSLALAQTGRFDVSLLDFSPEALRYAESQFEKQGVAGEFVLGDALAEGAPEYDLVFNLGVLEHYTLAEQVQFLHGMKSRSRRYVMVLVPNLACYWYWVWRMNKTVTEGWPFGKEIPTVDLRDAFERAGLHYHGHAFLGEAWTESFISQLPGCPPETIELLHKVHKSGIVPEASRSYLFAALGSVDAGAPKTAARWTSKGLGYTPSDADAIAMTQDALAVRIAAENERKQFEGALAESARLAAENQRLREQLAEMQAPSARLDAANLRIANLEQKLDEVCSWATHLDDHPFEHFVKRSTLGAARAVFKALPVGDKMRSRAYNAFAEFKRRRRLRSVGAGLPDTEALIGVTLPEATVADIYVFGIIDWHFRIQRPQHLARELARRGHRVFYVSPAHYDHPDPGVQVEQLDPTLPLYQLRLHATGAPSIYAEPPTPTLRDELIGGLRRWLTAARSVRSHALVEHAFWVDLAEVLPNTDVVYDCMDHHEGFGGVDAKLVQREQRLIEEADLVVTSSRWLEHEVGRRARANVTIRNAGSFDHFSPVPDRVYRDPQGRRILGYFGAIAEWFDVALVEKVARANPDCVVLLIGQDSVGAGDRLAGLPNVELLGEQPYESLPHYLHGFDVCLLPFRVIPLTLATNPVKVYEYFAAGLPVVGTDLPEMEQFGEHARVGRDHDGFVQAVAASLAEDDEGQRAARIAFARANTWEARASAVVEAVEQVAWPKVSVVVLCYKNLPLTQDCLDSLVDNDDYPDMELIVVDNDSQDGTDEFLREWGQRHPEAKVILNDANLGYAAGTNVGMRAATGDYVVLLNNDTAVTPGWLRTLVRHHRRDPEIGLIGPVTSNIGNEAKVDVRYASLDEMPAAAQAYTLRRIGSTVPIRTLAFFCVMVTRKVIDECGLLDEAFGIGWFEDDDYCRRVERAGYKILLAEDCFVHHHLSAAIGQIPEGERRQLFEKNRVIYEEKWGPWRPHTYR